MSGWNCLIVAAIFSIAEVRDKLAEISEMRDVIAKDLWDVHSSAHAEQTRVD